MENAVEDIHHARTLAACLRPKLTEQPVEALSLSKLRAVGVIAADDGRCVMEKVTADAELGGRVHAMLFQCKERLWNLHTQQLKQIS